MVHEGFRNGRRIAEVKGASMIVVLATSDVQAVTNTTFQSLWPRQAIQSARASLPAWQGRAATSRYIARCRPEITTKQLQLILDIGSRGLAHCCAVGFRGRSFVLIRDWLSYPLTDYCKFDMLQSGLAGA
jgi:hypothetical protein